jgi:hypothetical protein
MTIGDRQRRRLSKVVQSPLTHIFGSFSLSLILVVRTHNQSKKRTRKARTMVTPERALTTNDIEMRLEDKKHDINNDDDDHSSSKNSSHLNGEEGSSSNGTSGGSRSGTDDDVESIKNHLTKRETEAVFRLRIAVLLVLVLGTSQNEKGNEKRVMSLSLRSWTCLCVCSFCVDIQPRWECP